ncbi:MAG: hypothetical protein M5U31_07760 [Acidimicrobiia bacterium]|nr:hypothetical protein [Acidimicrobiia bacterium]
MREQRRLALPAATAFDPAEIAGLPEPVRRYFTAAIAPGTPASRSVELRMRGSIRIGRWMPFRADEILTPLRGFVWRARAAGIISGSDRFVDDKGVMRWKLAGVVPVMSAEGPDISRSAAGRAGGEGLWLPTALLPRFGVAWDATDDGHITARFRVGETAIELRHTIDDAGRVTASVLDRWGDPDSAGTFASHPFGGDVTGYGSFGGITIPTSGRLGWGYGTDSWPDGEFFRYQLTDVEPVG